MLLVAPAAQREERATQLEIDDAQAQWFRCLIEQARALDDGTAPIGTIVSQVKERCHAVLMEAAAVATRGDDDAATDAKLDKFIMLEAAAPEDLIRRLHAQR